MTIPLERTSITNSNLDITTRKTGAHNILNYLKQAISITCSIDEELTCSEISKCWEFTDAFACFLQDSEQMYLYLFGVLNTSTSQVDLPDLKVDNWAFHIDYNYTVKSESDVVLVFLKQTKYVDVTAQLQKQLVFANLPLSSRHNDNSYNSSINTVHSYVKYVLEPFFVNSAKETPEKSTTTLPNYYLQLSNTKKVFTELELSLANLQTDRSVPHVILYIHPVIKEVILQSQVGNTELSVQCISSDTLSNPKFLNSLNVTVHSWINSINKLVETSQTKEQGSASQEIRFWHSLCLSYNEVYKQLTSLPVKYTLEVLNFAKRFHTTASFLNNTNLRTQSDIANRVASFLVDIPLSSIQGASSLDSLHEAITLVHTYFMKRWKTSSYPLSRTITFLNCLADDFLSKLTEILGSDYLLAMSFADFQHNLSIALNALTTWDSSNKEFLLLVKHTLSKRKEAYETIYLNEKPKLFMKRLLSMLLLRQTYENLTVTLSSLSSTDQNDIELLKTVDDFNFSSSLDLFQNVNVLDITEDGRRNWNLYESKFNDILSKFDNSFISFIKEKFESCENTTRLISMFLKYNSLLMRPKIKNAVREYHLQLINGVNDEVITLKSRFTDITSDLELFAMHQLRDIPPVSGAIMWSSQVTRRLQKYCSQLDVILGDDLTTYNEGTRLKSEAQSLQKRLDPLVIYKSWLSSLSLDVFDFTTHIFKIVPITEMNCLEISVTLDSQLMMLIKEFRTLSSMGYEIPERFSKIISNSQKLQSIAANLSSSTKLYNQSAKVVETSAAQKYLLAEVENKIQCHISENLFLTWEDFLNDQTRQSEKGFGNNTTDIFGPHAFIYQLNSLINIYCTKYESVMRTCSEIDSKLIKLENDDYVYEGFLGLLKEIQVIVDRLYVDGYSNLHKVVVIINERIHNILVTKLKRIFENLCLLLKTTDGNYITSFISANLSIKILLDKSLIMQPISLSFKNGVISLEPSIQDMLTSIFQVVNYLFSSVKNLPAIYLRGYPTNGGLSESKSVTFVNTPKAVDVEVVNLLTVCSNALADIKSYVTPFERYSVFDTRLLDKFSTVSLQQKDLLQLVQYLAYTKATLSEVDDEVRFGIFKVDLVPFRSRTTYSLSKWIGFYFELLSQELVDSAHDLRKDLSHYSNVLRNIKLSDWELVKEANESIANLKISLEFRETALTLLELLRSTENIFKDTNYHLTNGWIPYKLLLHEADPYFIALNDVDNYYTTYRSKLIEFAKNSCGDLRLKLAMFFSNWDLEKTRLHEHDLEKFSTVLKNYSEDLNSLRELLGEQCQLECLLGIPTSEFSDTSKCFNEIFSYKELLTTISKNVKVLRKYEKTPWLLLNCEALVNELTEHAKELDQCPSNMKSLAPYTKLTSRIVDILGAMPLLSELKSNNFGNEHWQKLLSAMGILQSSSSENWTLEDVLGFKFDSHQSLVKDIIKEADEEATIRNTLQTVCLNSESYEFQFVLYDNRTYLLKDCNKLISDCEEWIDQLNTVKLFENYNQVKYSADELIGKLSDFLDFLNVWMEIQQHWTYLDGVFSTNEVFQSLLPQATVAYFSATKSYTQGINLLLSSKGVKEFYKLQSPKAFADTLLLSLIDIKRMLVDYFESERLKFPRLFFLGDEDLLELVCHINHKATLDKYIGTLFPGMNGLIINQGDGAIEKLITDEYLSLVLSSPVKIKQESGCFEWISFIEEDIKNILLKTFGIAYSVFDESFDIADLNLWFPEWLKSFPSQILLLCFRCYASYALKKGIQKKDLTCFDASLKQGIEWLSKYAMNEENAIIRKKALLFINEKLHYRSLVKALVDNNFNDYYWFREIKCSYNVDEHGKPSINVEMFSVSCPYAFHYVQIESPFVYTELTRETFSTLIHAIQLGFGGAPSGPAGTGKTETVKALGAYLGRYVFVFNCDESFNYKVIRRILIGLCQLGVYACFDEFNRLNPGTLSTVSQDIQLIQTNCKRSSKPLIPINNQFIKADRSFCIFITLNPSYQGRSELPCNLKRLFRTVWMETPDAFQICQVLLYSNGFNNSSDLANVLTSFFKDCAKQFSQVPYYDFGLRTIRAIIKVSCNFGNTNLLENESCGDLGFIYRAIQTVILPRLNVKDVKAFDGLRRKYFKSILTEGTELNTVNASLEVALKDSNLTSDLTYLTQKVIQLHQLSEVYNGIIIYGSSGSGKTLVWKNLLNALSRLLIKTEHYVISPKSIDKDSLFGTLDLTTHEWTDGIFTKILRSAIGSSTRYWIIFDDDITPDWVETMNSLLDDNRFLTLPNGERIPLSVNVKILFEVDNIQSATMATISRCGIVYMDEEPIAYNTYTESLLKETFTMKENSERRKMICEVVTEVMFELPIDAIFEFASTLFHVMELERSRFKETLFLNFKKEIVDSFGLLELGCFPGKANLAAYLKKKFLLSIAWACIGDSDLDSQFKFTNWIKKKFDLGTGISNKTDFILDLDVDTDTQNWVGIKDILANDKDAPGLGEVIRTTEVIRYEKLINNLLYMNSCLIFCGPPGSGKSMTVLHFLNGNDDIDVAVMNFSASTSAYAIIRFLERNTVYSIRANASYVTPKNKKTLAVFFDEINLPKPSRNNGNDALCFLRCVLHHKGFWHPKLKKWINMKRILIFGACNPPTDHGRSSLSSRILRKSVIIQYGYPGFDSLTKIYKPICDKILNFVDRSHSGPVIKGFLNCSVNVYDNIKRTFSSKEYIIHTYTPRELTKWFNCLLNVTKSLNRITFQQLLQIWYHEACRVFLDRLNHKDFRLGESILQESLFSEYDGLYLNGLIEYYTCNLFSERYSIVSLNTLRSHLQGCIESFRIVYPNSMFFLTEKGCLDAIRIGRVFAHTNSHAVIYGEYGSNQRSVLEFVSWKLGYKLLDFNPCLQPEFSDLLEELKTIINLVVTDSVKLCLAIDHFQCVNSDVFEVMNNLLTGSDISCLFSDEEWENLKKSIMLRHLCKLDSEVVEMVQTLIGQNLHVFFIVYTSSYKGLNILSPALINRCTTIYFQPPDELTVHELFKNELSKIPDFNDELDERCLLEKHLPNLVKVLFDLHSYMAAYFRKRKNNLSMSPNFLSDFVVLFVKVIRKLRSRLYNEKDHVDNGLKKLKQTEQQIHVLKNMLYEQESVLNDKTKHANSRLHNLMNAKQEVEIRQKEVLDLERNLRGQNEEIESKTSLVLKELSIVKPAIEEAKASVSNIKKSHLSELRSLSRPPDVVKLTMEAVCKLLGHKITSWKSVQSLLKREDFITNVLTFDSEKQLNPTLRKRLETEYFRNSTFKYEVVNRASKACGPLFLWIRSHCNYSKVLQKISPLNDSVSQLKAKGEDMQRKLSEVKSISEGLDKELMGMQEDYATLITEVHTLKIELANIQDKLKRSLKIIDDMASEKDYWENFMNSFDEALSNLNGRSVLVAFIINYAGLLDPVERETVVQQVSSILIQEGYISSNQNIGHFLQEFNNDMLNETKLPYTDDYSMTNMAITNECVRPALVIDPSLYASEPLKVLFGNSTICLSLISKTFKSQLKAALKLGKPILIKDVENWCPLLDMLLSPVLYSGSGKVSVKVSKDVFEVSVPLKIIIHSNTFNDSFMSYKISSFTTIINYTPTSSGLSRDLLNSLITIENGDLIQNKNYTRERLLQIKSELFTQQKNLLTILSSQNIDILANDDVVLILNSLRASIAEKEKLDQQRISLETSILDVSSHFSGNIDLFTFLIFVFKMMSKKNSRYDTSMKFFASLYSQLLLQVNSLNKNTLRPKNLFSLTMKVITEVCCLSLLPEDRSLFALLISTCLFHEECRPIWKAIGVDPSAIMDRFHFRKSFACEPEMLNTVRTFYKQLENSDIYETNYNSFIEWFSESVLGVNVLNIPTKLDTIISEGIGCDMPLILIPLSGIDVKQYLEQCLAERQVRCITIPMGSLDSEELADTTLIKAEHEPCWVFLENIHLSQSWLENISSKLKGDLHPEFRMVCTSDISFEFPIWLSPNFRYLYFDVKASFKETLMRNLRSVFMSELGIPQEYDIMRFLIAWIHTMIFERFCIVEVNREKRADLNDIDLFTAMNALSACARLVSSQKKENDIQKFPWDMFQELVLNVAYAPKLSSRNDISFLSNILLYFIKQLKEGRVLNLSLSSNYLLNPPSEYTFASCEDFAKGLPDNIPPVWLGIEGTLKPNVHLIDSKEVVKDLSNLLKDIKP